MNKILNIFVRMDIPSGSAIDVFSLPRSCLSGYFVHFFRSICLDVLSGRHFARIEDFLGHYFGTSYELLGLDPTFGLL